MGSKLIELHGGRVYDPTHGVDGEVRSIFVRDGRIVAAPSDPRAVDVRFDLTGCSVMAGGIDIHTHIGGGKVNLARMLLPEDHRSDLVPRGRHPRMGCGHAAPSTLTVGYRYAEMGYTACFEPAMLPANARQAHLEMGDTPIVDKGAYVLLGNDDLLLRMLADKADPARLRDYIAWTLHAAQAMAIKVVNPGGINAFKFNQRKLDLDEANAHYGVTPRTVLTALASGIQQLGLPHPLHIHGCNLGVPGNLDTTLATVAALDGLPAHLTHVQFHSYGTEGDRKFSSGAARIAEIVNRSPNISMDVGQVLFGQTVTESGDSMRQYAGSAFGSPKKSVLMDIECDAGCGVVPFKYKDKNFVNALQWAIGLELFLLVEDPWRLFLTTDHPNGAPFTTYPHLIRLLTDRSFRNDMLKTINPDAAAASTLGSLEREYSLYEIAIMTRAGPAKSLGLSDLGQLGIGARADITVYLDDPDRERMFTSPRYVFKAGELIVENGRVLATPRGDTHVVRVEYDRGIEAFVDDYFARYMTLQRKHLAVADGEIEDGGRGGLVVHGARRPT
ncbi:MAG: formylmethanofuran dehydrogenase subunit A [Gammaproteobacteria bacterium]|nr:formylmethanofuran dehydrogenase subunit A [Gammaproteobacteria bacterium]